MLMKRLLKHSSITGRRLVPMALANLARLHAFEHQVIELGDRARASGLHHRGRVLLGNDAAGRR